MPYCTGNQTCPSPDAQPTEPHPHLVHMQIKLKASSDAQPTEPHPHLVHTQIKLKACIISTTEAVTAWLLYQRQAPNIIGNVSPSLKDSLKLPCSIQQILWRHHTFNVLKVRKVAKSSIRCIQCAVPGQWPKEHQSTVCCQHRHWETVTEILI